MPSVTEQIIAELKVAYWMELETVTNYIANSVNLDGVRAEEIKKALQAEDDNDHAAANRGYRFLTENALIPPDFNQITFDEVWQAWPEPLKLRHRTSVSLSDERWLSSVMASRFGPMTTPGSHSSTWSVPMATGQ